MMMAWSHPGLTAQGTEAVGCEIDAWTPSEQTEGGRAYEELTVSFSVTFHEITSPYQIISAFALPNEDFDFEALASAPGRRFEACSDGGQLRRRGDVSWTWKAPKEPGFYQLRVSEMSQREALRINLFVLSPYAGESEVEGYLIGEYRTRPLRNNPAYAIPKGLVRVTPELMEVWVSPHFQLRQFLCKQASDFPKFLILRTRLLMKLESLLARAHERGYSANTFAILSGYRTPWYNASIGNTTSYSRHAYGDAADIYLDLDGNGTMDDLDGNGRIDANDARILYDLVEDNVEKIWYRPFIGGLSLYGPKPHRGPFVHVDTRGHRARW